LERLALPGFVIRLSMMLLDLLGSMIAVLAAAFKALSTDRPLSR
jgi:hypothetical protein